MPFVQIHTARSLSPDGKRALGLALAQAYAEHMRTSSRIVNVGFVHYADGDLARYDAADDGPREMTVVTCDVRAGRAPEQHEAFGRAVTQLCARALGIDELRVAVYLTEHAASQIHRDGGRAPDWSPAEGAAPSGQA